MRVLWKIEMWCRRQAAAAILPLLLVGWLTGESSEALTTFGKSNTQPPKDVAPTAPPDMFGAVQIGITFCLLSATFYTIAVEETKQPVVTPEKARPCSRQTDCAGTTSSSCVRTHYDAVTRCLCGDNSPPLNGQCEAQSKLLYHVCANSDECNDGLVCGTPNITSNAPHHLRVLTPQDKICLCDTESGYREREYACSDADILKTSILAIFLVVSLRNFFVN